MENTLKVIKAALHEVFSQAESPQEYRQTQM